MIGARLSPHGSTFAGISLILLCRKRAARSRTAYGVPLRRCSARLLSSTSAGDGAQCRPLGSLQSSKSLPKRRCATIREMSSPDVVEVLVALRFGY